VYLGTKMVDLVGSKGDRSVGGLWGRVGWVIPCGDGGGCEGDGDLWDVRGTIDNGSVAIRQLATGVACE
jgi:hypothetical protein